MAEHLPLLLVGLVLGLIGSIFCFYYPEILSKNIIPHSKPRYKIFCSILMAAGLMVLIYMFEPENFQDWITYLFFFLFYLIVWVDGYAKVIPNRLLVVLVLISSVSLWIEPDIQKVYAFLFIIVFCFLVYLIGKQFTSKKYVGWGDVKLVSVIALFTGWEFIMIIYIGIVLAGVFTSVGILSKKLKRDDQVPLTPFFFAGHITCLIVKIRYNLQDILELINI